MFEPGMKLFEVQCRRNGQETATFVLHAFNPEDAVLRARNGTDAEEQGWPVADPFRVPEGLEVRVGAVSDPLDRTKTVYGDWSSVSD